jgi:hypothetical protein
MDGGIRATCNLAEKERKEVWEMGGERTRQGLRKKTGRSFGNTGSFEQRRRRVNFILDFR